MSNIVAIVGRPNVGKSTLFNRLTESRDAIVDEMAGVTRDRHYGKAEWQGREFTLIDTGGYVSGSEDIFEEEIRSQVKIAIEEADMLLFVVDVTMGVTDLDRDVADVVRRWSRKTMLIANKVDNHDRISMSAEFYSLGLGDPFCISSINGSGTGDMLDELVKYLPEQVIEDDEDLPRIAVVGRPNVGKSSFVNALLGKDRNIVTDIAGTTRDTINTRYKAFGHDFYLVDTAGLRKKGKVHEDVEFYSVMRTVKAIENCDVCILMLDATEGIEAQDLNILWLALRNHRGVVILVNKWDLLEKETNTSRDFADNIKKRIAPFRDVPIIFTSATQKQRLLKAIEEAVKVYENRKRQIPTRKLNDFILPVVQDNPPPAVKGKYLKIKYATQLKSAYPQFVFFCNLPQYFKEPYKRFIENKLREEYDFTGVPIQIFFRAK
ncbi:MAG: ribosome biogenesis GTPase Der [Bacteroidetes bacterium]|nr:ribosome biogenesis GTPase Der [Bacteroidota bacterium]